MIKIIDTYYFTADSNQYILYECGTRKKIDIKTKKVTDEEIEYKTEIGFYSDITNMLKKTVELATRKKIANEELTNLKDVISNLTDLYETLLDKTSGF